jgi:hypothetical protein
MKRKEKGLREVLISRGIGQKLFGIRDDSKLLSTKGNPAQVQSTKRQAWLAFSDVR